MGGARPLICTIPVADFVRLLQDIEFKLSPAARPQFWTRERTVEEMFYSLRMVLYKTFKLCKSESLDIKRLLSFMVIIAMEKVGIPHQSEIDEVLETFQWKENKVFDMRQIFEMNAQTAAHIKRISGINWSTLFDKFHVCFVANVFQMAFPEASYGLNWTRDLEEFFIQFTCAFWNICDKMVRIHCVKELAKEPWPEEEVPTLPDFDEPHYNILENFEKNQSFVQSESELFDVKIEIDDDEMLLPDPNAEIGVMTNQKERKTDNNDNGPICKKARLQHYEKEYFRQFFTKHDLGQKRAVGIENAMRRYKKVTGENGNHSFFFRTWTAIRNSKLKERKNN